MCLWINKHYPNDLTSFPINSSEIAPKRWNGDWAAEGRTKAKKTYEWKYIHVYMYKREGKTNMGKVGGGSFFVGLPKRSQGKKLVNYIALSVDNNSRCLLHK